MRRVAWAWLVVMALAAPARAQASENWARAQARELTSQAEAEVAAGRTGSAARLFLDALTLDGSYPGAYLGLGSMRERAGDVREAERVYSLAIERVPGFWQAMAARARLRWRVGQRGEALDDLSEAVKLRRDDLALTEELAGWHIERGEFVRALALYRQARRLLDAQVDEASRARVKLRVKALAVLAAEADVLRARHPGRDPVRGSIEALVRREGW